MYGSCRIGFTGIVEWMTETPRPEGMRRIVFPRLLFASRNIWTRDGTFSGSGEVDERVLVDTGDPPESSSTTTRIKARPQHI